MITSDRDLLRLLPGVLRARDFHLYLEGGKRLCDLWLQGGRAVLGHKPPRVLGELKNAAERGLFCSFPHPLERRFCKALSLFFPDRAFRLYENQGSLLRALEQAGFPTPGPIPDPAFPRDKAPGGETISLWRPFLEAPAFPILVPVLPWPQGPAVLALDRSLDASFPPGELIPPILLAPAARALHNLASALKDDPRRGSFKALGELGAWQRRGIYLTGGAEGEPYDALFQRFLEGGFLIPPSPTEPLILPGSMSPGEASKLAELLRS